MDRRSFLRRGAWLAAAAALPRAALSAAPSVFAPRPAEWRVFEVTTRIEPQAGALGARAWLPLPSVHEAAWMRPMGNLWSGNARVMQALNDPEYQTEILFAEWDAGEPAPVIEVVSRFAARDRATDWNARNDARLSREQRRLYTRSTALIPTGGIVRRTAQAACGNARSDRDRARAIYDWIVDNTFRDPKTRGCGLGDIRTMLETGNLSGKCADLNTLYVGMCRAVGIPARDVYGVRVADSRFGYRSLGKSGDISKAQHCRAEVFLEGHGWVPADPADVRKVVLEEQPGLTLAHPRVAQVREQLFGAWETNWLAYNFAHDLALPFSDGPTIPFLMYPQGETADGRFDSLDPQGFRYTLTAAELIA
jgi:transglutaminase-like putative cysteine protease